MAGEVEDEWTVVEAPSLDALLSKCGELSAQGLWSEAVSVAEDALALAKNTGITSNEISAMCTLAQVQRRNGDAAQALDTAKQMRKLCHSTKDEEYEARALIEIAHAHLFQHEGKPASRAASAAVKMGNKADGGKGAHAEVRVAALLVLAEALLQLLVDYHSAAVKDERLLHDIDDSGARAFEAVREAAKICEHVVDNPQEDDDFEESEGQLVLHQQGRRDIVQDSRLRGLAFYWYARVFVIFQDKEQDALEAASKAKFLFKQVQDAEMQAEAWLLMAQAYHKMDPSTQYASNAAHDALALFSSMNNTQGKDRTFQLFQELGLAVRVAGAVGGAHLAVTAAGEGGGAATGGAAPAAAASVAEKPKGLDPEDVMNAVQEMAKAAIGLDEELFLDSPLMDSGMDSLTAVSFRNGLQQNLGVKLPSSLMFDYPTMKEVGNRIVELSLDDEE